MASKWKLLECTKADQFDITNQVENDTPEVGIDEICNDLAVMASTCDLMEAENRVLTLTLLHEHWNMNHSVKIVCLNCGLESLCSNENGVINRAEGNDTCQEFMQSENSENAIDIHRNAEMLKLEMSCNDENETEMMDFKNEVISDGLAIESSCGDCHVGRGKPVILDPCATELSSSYVSESRKIVQQSTEACDDSSCLQTEQVYALAEPGVGECESASVTLDEQLSLETIKSFGDSGLTDKENSDAVAVAPHFASGAKQRKIDKVVRLKSQFACKPFVCCDCHKVFSDSGSLRAHLQQSHCTSQCECVVCDKILQSASRIRKHVLTHTNFKRFHCEVCGRTFAQKQNLIVHLRCHRGEKPFQCTVCQQRFTQNQSLKSHMAIHTGHKPYQCDHCNFASNNKRRMLVHQDIHRGEKRYRCADCDKSFLYASSLKAHLHRHTGEKRFCCWKCGEKFNIALSLKRHMRRAGHLRPEDADKLYICPVCSLAFDVPSTLKYHMTIHTGELPFVCQVCGKKFRMMKNLRSHMMSHSDERPFPCATCGKAFKTAKDMRTHAALHSRTPPPYRLHSTKKSKVALNDVDPNFVMKFEDNTIVIQCPDCDLQFDSRADLRLHASIAGHSVLSKPYICECGRAFDCAAKLKVHAVIHSGTKPYMCNECGRQFTFKSKLKQHIAIHTGDKRYPCELCGRSFVFQYLLKKHQATHSAERPFRCYVCGKGFAWGDNLTSHMAVHSDLRPFQCNRCGKSFKTKPHLKQHNRSCSRKESICF